MNINVLKQFCCAVYFFIQNYIHVEEFCHENEQDMTIKLFRTTSLPKEQYGKKCNK